ncbi:DUF547 domain-containing protein [Nonlabens sp. SCSIO 43208]
MNMKIYNLVAIAIFSCLMISCVSSRGINFKKQARTSNSSVPLVNEINHQQWDDLLKKHVREEGLVDYKGFQKDSALLSEYLIYLSENEPSEKWSYEEQLAYFINLYNASTVHLIVKNYPIKSIKDVEATISPFLKKFIQIGDEKLSLADVEKGILQKMNEPRIHFAINCASYSCPKLMRESYTAKNVDSLMEQATTEFINSDKNEITSDRVRISEIFKWYKKDFLKKANSIDEYINQYSRVKIQPTTEINYLEYDWRLNEVGVN